MKESGIRLDDSRDGLLFVFDGHLIRELSTIRGLRTNIEIWEKSIMLLRSIRRRAGVWDSWELANTCERTLKVLEDIMLFYKSLPSRI